MADRDASGHRPLSPVFHTIGVEAVAAGFGVDPATGLRSAEVPKRSAAAGPNLLEHAEPAPLWRMVAEAFLEPFVLMLAAAGLLAIVVGEVRDGLLVLIGLLPIVGADVVTEYRSERALEALREASAPTARVRRDGRAAIVTADGLVPGDVVLVQAGDVIPADLRIIRSDALLIDRSVLTGESVPEEARMNADAVGAALIDRHSMAFSGTSAVGGRGEGIVVAIGAGTEFGRIAAGLTSAAPRRSPLQRELDRLVRILLVVALGLIAFTSSIGVIRGHPLGENVLAGISSAIAAIPEEPPVLLAVILGLGAYRLLKRGVLVRRLNAEETLGAVDLIVTDKTGTITRNALVVTSVRGVGGLIENDEEVLTLLGEALRAEEDAWRGEEISHGSFTRAIRSAIAELGGATTLDERALVEAAGPSDLVPLSRTVARRDGHREEFVLGAPEVVLEYVDLQCGGDVADRGRWADLIEHSAGAGERVLAAARRLDDASWEMRALVGFADPIRPGIADAMATARAAGIQVVVVTGDHPLTAAAIAQEAGLEVDRVVTGDEVATWDEARLARELPALRIVARSTPDQKRRIVAAARSVGRIVAVTGDGVNDAPALHIADVGVAMGSGTAVAREASDLTLGDDSFATLMYALREGREIVDNVQKGLTFLLSTHVAFLGFILISTAFVSERQVLIPLQILWMEFFIDLVTSIAFEREPPEPELMTRRPRHAGEPLLTNAILARLTGAGAFTAIASLVVMLTHGGGFDHAAWLAYTILVVSQCVRAYSNRSLRQPIHRLSGNGFLLAACVLGVVVQAVIPYVPGLVDAFRATPLDWSDWVTVAIVAFLPALLAQVIRAARPGRIAWVA